MGQRRRIPAPERLDRFLWRNFALAKIDLFGRKAFEGRYWQAEVRCQQLLGGVANPVADAEGAELGEVAVVKNQDEVTRFISQALEHVAVAAGKVPDVARFEVVSFGEAARGIDRSA